ncbi:MAG TPA: thrombospondin type 3 repeat-containing protein, partial [Candidatus Synoicihabitans sp.]|nr:thrombospondin type 3 repeat-containing protein [Candidatus Synoicihabitans sp.]
GDHRSFYTIMNNYFKPGPVTPRDDEIAFRILKPESRRAKPPVDDYGQAFVDGNIVEGFERVTRNNWDGGVQPEPIGPVSAVLTQVRAEKPYPHAFVEIQSARDAYETVLARAGATLPKRDAVDERVIESVRTGRTTAKAAPDVRSTLGKYGFQKKLVDDIASLIDKGIITDPSQVGGYPTYRGTPYADRDGDGLPDAWETRHGLDPNDATDAGGDLNGDGYTNIEDFINGLDPRAPKQDWTKSPRTYHDLFAEQRQ